MYISVKRTTCYRDYADLAAKSPNEERGKLHRTKREITSDYRETML